MAIVKLVTNSKNDFGKEVTYSTEKLKFTLDGIAEQEISDEVLEDILKFYPSTISIYSPTAAVLEEDAKKDIADDKNEATANEKPTLDILMKKSKGELTSICDQLGIEYNNVADTKQVLSEKILKVYSEAE